MSEAPPALRERSGRSWPPPTGAFPITVVVTAVTLVVYLLQVVIGSGTGFAGLRNIAGRPVLLVLLSPFLHASVLHLGYNLAVFLTLSPAAELRVPTGWYAAGVLAVGWTTNAAPSVLPGGTDFAVGLSGLTHALALFVLPFVLRGAIRSRGRRRVANALGLVLIAALALQTFVFALGWTPAGLTAVQAHLAGLAIGSIASFAVAPQFRRRQRRRESARDRRRKP